jgi:tRNA(Ile)-lysidine synthase
MRPVAPLPYHPELTVLRPLLDVTRAELEAYCREQQLTPRHDASNDALDTTRNRLRHEVLPLLENVYPQARQALLQLGTVAQVEDDYLNQQLEAWMAEHVTAEAGRVCAGREAFAALHPALQGRLILFAANQLAGPEQAPGYRVIRAALTVAQTGAVGAIAQLGAGLGLRVDYETIVIERLDAPASDDDLPLLDVGAAFEVGVPGAVPLAGGWSLVTSAEPLPPEVLRARLALPPGARISVRTRRRGDRFAPLGLGGRTQKLSKWLIDHKVPRDLRDRIALVLVDGQVAALVWGRDWPIGEGFGVRAQRELVAYFGLYRTSGLNVAVSYKLV